MRRFFLWGSLVVLFALNEWSFRFIFNLQPVDGFMQLMMVVLDLLLLPFIGLGFAKGGLYQAFKGLPKLGWLWVGWLIAFLMVFVLEIAMRIHYHHYYTAPYQAEFSWSPDLHLPHPELGHHLPKSTTVTHNLVVNDTLVYEVEYTMNEHRRRVASVNDSSRIGQPIILDGGSFAFGWGLPDEETLSHQLASNFADRPVYDLAVSGYGTQHVYMHAKDAHFFKGIPDSATLYYLFIDDHLRRLNGSKTLINTWGEEFPFLELEGDSVHYKGAFRSARFWCSLMWRCLGKSEVLRWSDVDLPWFDSDGTIELAASVLATSERALNTHHPNSELMVVIAPGSRTSGRLIPELEEQNVSYIDLSNLLDPNQSVYQLHWTEAHPNGLYYQKIAEAIFNYDSR